MINKSAIKISSALSNRKKSDLRMQGTVHNPSLNPGHKRT